MTDASNIFTEDNTQEAAGAPVTAENPGNTTPSFYESLVGDGKKYADQEALAKSRLHADEHISDLEAENAKLREAVAKAKAREELMEELKQQNKGADPAHSQTETNVETPTADSIDEHIRKVLEETDAAKRATDNIEIVSKAVYEIHGEKSREFIAQKAAELEVSVDFLMEAAAKSPKAALQSLGISAAPVQRQEVNVPKSSINSHVAGGSPDQKRYEELEAMRKNNSKAYYKDPKLTLEWGALRKKLNL